MHRLPWQLPSATEESRVTQEEVKLQTLKAFGTSNVEGLGVSPRDGRALEGPRALCKCGEDCESVSFHSSGHRPCPDSA